MAINDEKKFNIMILGDGGREHALALKVKLSPRLGKLVAVTQNPVIADMVDESFWGDAADPDFVVQIAQNACVDCVLSGSETGIEAGVGDKLESCGIGFYGPSRASGEIEWSKSFAKKVMAAADIPTAHSVIVNSKQACLDAALSKLGGSKTVVLKANGLASGKGVFLCKTEDEITQACEKLYSDMAKASETVLIEDFLYGRECSFFVMIGENDDLVPLGFAVDFKRRNDNDEGPNTGGMGCYAPVPWLPEDAAEQVITKVVRPLSHCLRSMDRPYKGFLYVGLMWGGESDPIKGPQVVEFNVRLGDPEAQILSQYDRRDWLEIMLFQCGLIGHCQKGSWHSELGSKDSKNDSVVGVVLASQGYPYDRSMQSQKIRIAESLFAGDPSLQAFAASVQKDDQGYFAGPGRIMTMVARAESLSLAREAVYKSIDKHFEAEVMHYRKDIGSQVR